MGHGSSFPCSSSCTERPAIVGASRMETGTKGLSCPAVIVTRKNRIVDTAKMPTLLNIEHPFPDVALLSGPQVNSIALKVAIAPLICHQDVGSFFSEPIPPEIRALFVRPLEIGRAH